MIRRPLIHLRAQSPEQMHQRVSVTNQPRHIRRLRPRVMCSRVVLDRRHQRTHFCQRVLVQTVRCCRVVDRRVQTTLQDYLDIQGCALVLARDGSFLIGYLEGSHVCG